MADQAITITPNRSIQTFGSVPYQPEKTHVPRGMVSFYSSLAPVAAKTLGNTMSVTATCTLPENFAYGLTALSVMMDCVTATDTSQMDAVGQVQLEPDNTVSNLSFLELFSNGTVSIGSGAGDRRIWTSQSRWCPILFNQGGNSPELQVYLADKDTANAADARRFSMQADFLIYDIRQATDAPVHSAVPVRVC